MPKVARSFRDTPQPVLSFLRQLLHEPIGITLQTSPANKANAFRFRQRLYGFRRSVLTAIQQPDSAEWRDATTWLLAALGPRGTKVWLDLTIFKVVPVGQAPDQFAVQGEIEQPMFGEMPHDPLSQEHADDLALVRAALAAKPTFGGQVIDWTSGNPLDIA
jgi:hypothetical protein